MLTVAARSRRQTIQRSIARVTVTVIKDKVIINR
jgi:hypothetical protein